MKIMSQLRKYYVWNFVLGYWFMKKLLAIIVLGLLWSENSFAGYGKGELKLTEKGVRGFYSYITNPGGKIKGTANPLRMVVSNNGNYVHWFVCRSAQCKSDGDRELVKICERKQSNPCSTFAVRRSVKWKNGINPGGKAAGFKKNMSLDEVKEKLAALGFYDGDVETRKKKNHITKKTETQKSSSNKKTTKGEVTYINTTTGDFFTIKKEVPYQYGKPRSSVPLSMHAEAKEKCLKSSRDNECEVYIVKHPNGKTKHFNPKTTYNKSLDKKPVVKKPVVKKPKQSAKIYSLNETRAIALKWDGYADLIAGTIEINEKDYKGEINLTLPNKDGSCNGSYSLQKDGRGTWQISCANNMGAAGTLEWVRDGGTTGKGRDYKDQKVQFTVANKS